MSEQELIEASPCKLHNGDWGCKTTHPVSVGDTVQIVTRANKQWRAQITQIVWTDDQICICTTESENGRKNASTSQDKSARQTAPKESGARTSETSSVREEYAPAPPPAAISNDDLDAMADAAAERESEFDDVMNTMAEFERNGRD